MPTEPEIFHSHVDECEQCRQQPMNLCQEGDRRLHEAAGTEVVPNRLWKCGCGTINDVRREYCRQCQEPRKEPKKEKSE